MKLGTVPTCSEFNSRAPLNVVESGKLEPHKLVTHRFAMNDIMKAYDTFGNAASERTLKVALNNDSAILRGHGHSLVSEAGFLGS